MSLPLRFSPQAWDDCLCWQATDKAMRKRQSAAQGFIDVGLLPFAVQAFPHHFGERPRRQK